MVIGDKGPGHFNDIGWGNGVIVLYEDKIYGINLLLKTLRFTLRFVAIILQKPAVKCYYLQSNS